jgi:hypothetical protein
VNYNDGGFKNEGCAGTTRVVGMYCHLFVDIFQSRVQDVAQRTNKVALMGQLTPFSLVPPTPRV